jgi:hypothetical protein
VVIWLGMLVGGLLLAGLSIYFVKIGLDRADKVASAISALVGLVGLGLAAYGVVLARAVPTHPPAPGERSQVVADSTISGDNIQIGKARDVDIRRRG